MLSQIANHTYKIKDNQTWP